MDVHLPVFLFLHGITSHLGLRTAGNFTMFSNLRTEGPASNHFLLRSNPLKLWGYQEDVVRFIDINDQLARITYQYQSLQGNQLPVVEFRKLIYARGKAKATIPMEFEVSGQDLFDAGHREPSGLAHRFPRPESSPARARAMIEEPPHHHPPIASLQGPER